MPGKSQSPPALEFSPTWLAASDPGLIRFQFAARATLSPALTTLTLYLVGKAFGIPVMSMALGVIVSLFGTIALQNIPAAQQPATMLLLPAPAAAAFALAAALAGWPVVADIVFVVIIFAAVEVRSLGQRWTAFGMIGFMSFFLGEYLHPALGQVPYQFIGLAVGTAAAALVRHVLLPDRPDRALHHVIGAIRRQVALLLNQVAEALKSGHPDAARRRRIQHDLASLNEAVLTSEEQIDALEAWKGGECLDGLRLQALLLERSVERFVSACLDVVGDPADPRLLASLGQLEAQLRNGEAADLEAKNAAVPADEASPSDRRMARLFEDLRQALVAFPESLGSSVDRDQTSQRRTPEPSDVPAKPVDRAQAYGLSSTTVQAIQVSSACAIAIAAGYLISPQRWYWAVITAFVMFTGASSRGDAFYKGLQRVAGTLAGAIAGVLLATVLGGHVAIQTGLILACIFLAFYSFQISYAMMIFWITIMIALLYGAMGYFAPPLLVTRLEETGIGAAAGIAVAAFLLPVRTRDTAREALRDYLNSLAQLLGHSDSTDAEGARDVPVELVHDLDRKFHAVRDAATFFSFGRDLRSAGVTGHGLMLLMATWSWAKEFSVRASSECGLPSEEFGTRISRVQDKVQELSASLGGDAQGPRDGSSRPTRPGEGVDDAPETPALRALRGLDEALDKLQAHVVGRARS